MVFSSVAEAQPFLEAIETEPNHLLNPNFTSTYGVAGISYVHTSLIATRSRSSETTFSPTPSYDSSAFSQPRTISALVHAAALYVGIFLVVAIF